MNNVSYRAVLAATGCMGRYEYIDFDELPDKDDLSYAEAHYSVGGIAYVVVNVFQFKEEED